MKPSWKMSVTEGIAELQFDMPDTDVNVLTLQNLRELDSKITEISSRKDIRAVLLTSGKKRFFIAGADIREIEKIDSREKALELAEEGKRLLQRIEDLKVPTIAVISGACLGGGYELAMAATRRVAANSEHVKIGL